MLYCFIANVIPAYCDKGSTQVGTQVNNPVARLAGALKTILKGR